MVTPVVAVEAAEEQVKQHNKANRRNKANKNSKANETSSNATNQA